MVDIRFDVHSFTAATSTNCKSIPSDAVPHFEMTPITANFCESGNEISGTTLGGKFY